LKTLKIFFIMAVTILFCSGVASANIEISPPAINLNLVGGGVATEPITITWRGEAPVVGFIETNIDPDGEGINVTYSENPIILIPNIPKTVDMTIKVAVNIMPDNYIINTVVLTDIEEVIKYRSGGTTTIYKDKEIIIENLTRINELLLIIQQLYDQINQTANCTECLPLIVMLQNTIDELTAIIKEDATGEAEPEKQYSWADAYFIFIIIICILCCILCWLICYVFWVLNSRTRKQVLDETKVSDEKESGSTGPINK